MYVMSDIYKQMHVLTWETINLVCLLSYITLIMSLLRYFIIIILIKYIKLDKCIWLVQ